MEYFKMHSSDEDFEPNVTDDYYDNDFEDYEYNYPENEDKKLLKKSNFMKPSEPVCLQSPEFKTGTENKNVWVLKLIIRNVYSLETNVQLYLISYKDPSDFCVHLSLLDKENKKIKQSEKSVASCRERMFEGMMVCEFENFMRDHSYYNNKIPINKQTLLCEIINSSPKSMRVTKNTKSDDLKLFLSKEELSDVTVSVGETKFRLHKAILASRSAVFLAMFQHDTKENRESLVEITDVDEKIMKKVILYIYTDEIENLEEDVCHILAVADKYGMEGLKSTCNEELSNSLNSDNVFQILALADTYNAKNLKIKALRYIASNLTELIDKPGYKMLRNKYPHLIEKILLAVATKLKDL